MPNPENTGTFEQFITGRIDFEEINPKTGSSGDFEQFITGRIDFSTYVEKEAPVHVPRNPFYIYQDPAIV